MKQKETKVKLIITKEDAWLECEGKRIQNIVITSYYSEYNKRIAEIPGSRFDFNVINGRTEPRVKWEFAGITTEFR